MKKPETFGVAAACMAVVLICIGVIGLVSSAEDSPDAVPDMNGKPVTFEAGAKPSPEASPTPDIGTEFEVPSVGLDIPLGALSAVNGEITPPGFTSAYWIRNVGVSPKDADTGTVYVVMHSLRDGAVGPGNYLIDVANERAAVDEGAKILVDGISFSVTSSRHVSKSELPNDAEIWADTTNRLVIITCLQRADGSPSTDNMVIIAERT
ncbi:class F sortase [Paramicrobacterium sp. CJ85]|uniref:class F sortase n=1 Tax=Paramicrobacterium sp. CJ85 TaxID=3445355 RepID=UPI003F5FC34B